MRAHRWTPLAELAVVLTLFLAGLWLFGQAATRVPFQVDEDAYVVRSRYFSLLFLERNLHWRQWGDSFHTHTQPMLTNYVVGAGLWLQGYDPDNLRVVPAYDPSKSADENRARLRRVDWDLLSRARTIMVPIAAAIGVLLYLLGRVLAGPIAGLAAAGLALASPLSQEHLVQARSEPVLMLFALLTLLLAVLGARRGGDGGLPLRWAVAVGLALGLAFSSKLTATMSVLATVAWAALAASLAALRPTGPGPRWREVWRATRGWLLALAIAVGVFVGSNPHLYRGPLQHTLHLYQNRVREMQGQQDDVPRRAVHGPIDGVGRVLSASLVSQTATGSRWVPLELVLAVLGVAVLLRAAGAALRRGVLQAEGLVLLTTLFYFVGIGLVLPLDWSRYYVPTLLFGTLLSGVGLTAMVGWLRTARAGVAGRRILGQGWAEPDSATFARTEG
jgi:hypothetical protein